MKKKLLFIVTVFIVLPISNFAQKPDLGAAARFVLFTSSGAVGNTQRSQLTGDVGTNARAITGFGNVDGVIHLHLMILPELQPWRW